MQLTRRLLLAGGATLAAPAILRAQNTPIRIGEINSYTAVPSFTLPYRNGWMLGLEHANAAGGVLGRKLEFVSRDDAGKPQDAVRLAGELINDAKVDLLAGTFLSNIGLAVSDFALQNKRLFIAGEPLTDALIWDKGNRYTFRLRPGTYKQAAMLVDRSRQAAGQALGDGGAELRIRPVGGEVVQAAAAGEAAGRAVRRRAMAGARQDRRRRHACRRCPT